jgi:inner membrane transporter RhtA
MKSLNESIPPHLYFIGSAIFHYLGPSFAVLLFARVSVNGVTWLRIVSSGIIFALWWRPWKVFVEGNRKTRLLVIELGTVLALMNYSFYHAIYQLPLSTVAAIEFIGPILLALIGIHSRRNIIALVLAVAGVYLLTEVRFTGKFIGYIWAFIDAVLFTFYIVLAHRISRCDNNTKSIDLLGAAMLVAVIVITPLGIIGAIPAMSNIITIAAGFGIGISSSVIPYVFDQFAMARLPRSTYSLFVALLPATAVAVGIIILHQFPTTIEIVAIGFVIGGVLLHRKPATDYSKSSQHYTSFINEIDMN